MSVFTFHCVAAGSSEVVKIEIDANNITQALDAFHTWYPTHEVGIITYPPIPEKPFSKLQPVINWKRLYP